MILSCFLYFPVFTHSHGQMKGVSLCKDVCHSNKHTMRPNIHSSNISLSTFAVHPDTSYYDSWLLASKPVNISAMLPRYSWLSFLSQNSNEPLGVIFSAMCTMFEVMSMLVYSLLPFHSRARRRESSRPSLCPCLRFRTVDSSAASPHKDTHSAFSIYSAVSHWGFSL